MKIYLASSHKNVLQPAVLAELRRVGYTVYDFKNPAEGVPGFSWSEVDPDWRQWDEHLFIGGLRHPAARAGFQRDFEAMQDADACVLLLPCGRSAHSEAGFMKGSGKPVFVLLSGAMEAELMYGLFDAITFTTAGLISVLQYHQNKMV